MDSRIVDASRHPLTVYHGTAEDFAMFQVNPDEGGIFFSSSTRVAEEYANWRQNGEVQSGGGRVLVAHLEITNPLVVPVNGPFRQAKIQETIARAKLLGHDGVVLLRIVDGPHKTGKGPEADTYIVFHPNQVKPLYSFSVA